MKNSDSSLFLYDAAGKLVDQSAFVGTAPEGESFNRINYEFAAQGGRSEAQGAAIQNFAWGEPTPGAANKITANTQITNNQYPNNIPLNTSSLNIIMVIVMAISLGLALAGILIYSFKQDDDLQELFFGKNQRIW